MPARIQGFYTIYKQNMENYIFFRQHSTQLDIIRFISTNCNSCDFERKDFIYSIPIY